MIPKGAYVFKESVFKNLDDGGNNRNIFLQAYFRLEKKNVIFPASFFFLQDVENT